MLMYSTPRPDQILLFSLEFFFHSSSLLDKTCSLRVNFNQSSLFAVGHTEEYGTNNNIPNQFEIIYLSTPHHHWAQLGHPAAARRKESVDGPHAARAVRSARPSMMIIMSHSAAAPAPAMAYNSQHGSTLQATL